MANSLKRRLYTKVNKRGPFVKDYAVIEYPEIVGTRCWEFIGFIDDSGYGNIYYIDRVKRTHIVSYTLSVGKIPKNYKGKKACILHKCDNRKCIRPLHLFLGNRTLNNLDKLNKGRQSKGLKHSLATIGTKPYRPGEKNPNAKLTDEDADRIRLLFHSGEYLQRELAEMFGCTQPNIGYIVRNESFVHM